MEEKVKEIVEIKQRSLAEENQKTLEALKDRYNFWIGVEGYKTVIYPGQMFFAIQRRL